MLEVRKWLSEMTLLREVFARAKMEPLRFYCDTAAQAGLEVEVLEDLREATFPTFARWRENAIRNHEQVSALVGEHEWKKFLDSCEVLERLWRAERLGYGLIAAVKPD